MEPNIKSFDPAASAGKYWLPWREQRKQTRLFNQSRDPENRREGTSNQQQKQPAQTLKFRFTVINDPHLMIRDSDLLHPDQTAEGTLDV